MIIGTGIDLVDVRRIQKLMGEHEARFIEKYFTPYEASYIQQFNSLEKRALSLAKRFAAKEACAKALGTGFQNGVAMKDLEIKNDVLGKPVMTISGKALELVEKSCQAGQTASIHLSMTDEPPYAQAQVIIEVI